MTYRPAKISRTLLAPILALVLALGGCSSPAEPSGSAAGSPDVASAVVQSANALDAPTDADAPGASQPADSADPQAFDYAQVPAYSGSPSVEVCGNVPSFSDADLEGAQESYDPLDALGRCGTAQAIVSPATMPAAGEERGAIGMVKPTGWHTVRYDDLVDGKYLYNRCHLIGWQLTAENANQRNLITGTRYLNTEGMLPFEDQVADYVRSTGGRVLYRATPVFVGTELVARGVHLEGRSVDDDGAGVCFNVFCYNVQPGVGIDYATGDSWRDDTAQGAVSGGGGGQAESRADADAQTGQGTTAPQTQGGAAGNGAASTGTTAAEARTYVLNTNTRKFHLPGCRSVNRMSEKNKQEVTAARNDLLAQGYEPCGNCNP